jgi:hypothetical protein
MIQVVHLLFSTAGEDRAAGEYQTVQDAEILNGSCSTDNRQRDSCS